MKPLSTEAEVYFSPEAKERIAANLRGVVPIADVDIIEVGPVMRGGPGSGHFDHKGRPGERGGSQPGEGGERRYEIDADRAFPRGFLQHHSIADVSSWRDRLTEVLTTPVDTLRDKYVGNQVPAPNTDAEAVYDRMRYAVAGLKDQMAHNAIRPGDARMQKVGFSSDDYWILRDGTLVPVVLHEQSSTEAIKILLATGDMPKDFFQGTDFSGEAVFRALGFARWSVSGDEGLQFSDEVPLTGAQIAVIQALAVDAMAVDDLNWETEELEVVTHESAATGKPRVFIGERNGREGEGIPAFLEFSPIARSIINRGGEGSGHFGHAGRPGERGGSAPGTGGEKRYKVEGLPSFSPGFREAFVKALVDQNQTVAPSKLVNSGVRSYWLTPQGQLLGIGGMLTEHSDNAIDALHGALDATADTDESKAIRQTVVGEYAEGSLALTDVAWGLITSSGVHRLNIDGRQGFPYVAYQGDNEATQAQWDTAQEIALVLNLPFTKWEIDTFAQHTSLEKARARLGLVERREEGPPAVPSGPAPGPGCV